MPTVSAEEIAATARAALPQLLVALDFDGTLAPIVVDPMSSRPVDGTLDALRALAREGAHVGVITGRDALTVVALGGFETVPGLVVAGLFGAEWWQDGELHTPTEPPAIKALRDRLRAAVAAHSPDPAVWVEDKRLSLVVHTRPADDPAGARAALLPPVTALADELGLVVHAGRAVLEIAEPGSDKGNALRHLVARFAPETVLFAGDDIGDLPAFAVIRELRTAGLAAWSVAVASAEAPEVAAAADLVVDGPAGVVDLLASLTA